MFTSHKFFSVCVFVRTFGLWCQFIANHLRLGRQDKEINLWIVYTHSHTHSHSHTHTHTRTHEHTNTLTRIRTCTCTHVHVHVHYSIMYAHTHTYMYMYCTMLDLSVYFLSYSTLDRRSASVPFDKEDPPVHVY